MNTSGSEIKIISGNSSKELAQKIADYIGVPVADCTVGKFSDGEISVNMNETVRGCDVFVVQSTNSPVNDNLMELLILIDALRRASAGRITAVIPYYGYARQDRKAKSRDPITAKLVANLITAAGADRVLTMDLHAAQIQGYFDIPLDHLLGGSILADYFNQKGIEDLVVVSPDLGSVTRSRKFANGLDGDVPLAIIDKRRPKANVCEVMNIIGDVKGKNVILLDDMIDTAGTITNAANALKEFGAKDIYACCTHGVLSGPAIERIDNSAISELIVLDTIQLPEEKKIDKRVVSDIIYKLEKSERPVVFVGNGVRLAGAHDKFLKLIEKMNIPVVTGMSSIDAIASDNPLYVGRNGTTGDRAGNFAIQNCDVLLSLGSRLSFFQTGFDYKSWARSAYKIINDIDPEELEKDSISADVKVCCNVNELIDMLNDHITGKLQPKEKWIEQCQYWKKTYPVVLEKHETDLKPNIYSIYKKLTNLLNSDDCLVVSAGTSRVVGSQASVIKEGMRFIANPSCASMGYDLPPAIGVCIARENVLVMVVCK